MSIEVYFCSGEAVAPWMVGLHDGHAITKIFSQFRSPLEAIRYAFGVADTPGRELAVKWPTWLKVVLP